MISGAGWPMVMITVSLDAAQPFVGVIVHIKVFSPMPRSETSVVGFVGFSIVPFPLNIVQRPSPLNG